MLYSPSTGGFYLPEIHRIDIPEDTVNITVEDYRLLLKGQEQGKQIAPDLTGQPRLVVVIQGVSDEYTIEQLIVAKTREMAIVELKADGIIEAGQNGKLVLTKKVRQ